MYIIEIPHERDAIGHSHYKTALQWATSCAVRLEVELWSVPAMCARFLAVEMCETISDVRRMRERYLAEHRYQWVRVVAICDEWIEAAP